MKAMTLLRDLRYPRFFCLNIFTLRPTFAVGIFLCSLVASHLRQKAHRRVFSCIGCTISSSPDQLPVPADFPRYRHTCTTCRAKKGPSIICRWHTLSLSALSPRPGASPELSTEQPYMPTTYAVCVTGLLGGRARVGALGASGAGEGRRSTTSLTIGRKKPSII
jgi:hypothetical protein